MSKNTMMFAILAVVVVAAVGAGAVIASGGDDETESNATTTQTAAESSHSSDKSMSADHGEADPALLEVQDVTLEADESKFGEIIVDQKGRTLYVFEPDGQGESTCYGECADFWPPVLVNGEPELGEGLSSKAGVTKRKDGKLQATYDGRPLYYVIGEDVGQVKCQAMDMHGGLWYVQSPDGTVITKA